MRKVKTLGLLGTGVIGGGWAARALHFGIDVIAVDSNPKMDQWIRDAVANAEPASVLTLSHEPTHTLATVSSRAERTIAGSSTAHAGPRKVNTPEATAQKPTTTAAGASANAAIAAAPSASA